MRGLYWHNEQSEWARVVIMSRMTTIESSYPDPSQVLQHAACQSAHCPIHIVPGPSSHPQAVQAQIDKNCGRQGKRWRGGYPFSSVRRKYWWQGCKTIRRDVLRDLFVRLGRISDEKLFIDDTIASPLRTCFILTEILVTTGTRRGNSGWWQESGMIGIFLPEITTLTLDNSNILTDRETPIKHSKEIPTNDYWLSAFLPL